MHSPRAIVCLLPKNGASAIYLSLLLSYAILISMFAPFLLRKAEAASAGPGKASASPASMPAMKKGHWRDGELIVRFRQGASEQDKNTLIATKGAKRDRKLRGKSGLEKLRLAAGKDLETAAAELRRNPMVEIAEPNYLISRDEIVPDDPQFGEQWALRNTGQNGGQVTADIRAAMAWETTTGSPSTVIAVIDSGIDFTHPDLAHNLWTNTSEQPNGVDDDHNGLIDDLHGWDWVAASNQIKDKQGHGTAMAGLIAAEGNNATGTTGVMWRASLMSLRVLDSNGTGDVARAVEAIDYAVAKGATVINCSWGTDGESIILREAIQRAAANETLVISSAGNGARDIDSAPYYPASYDLPNVISVAATNDSNQLAPNSDWGATHVTAAAPGADLLTTKMGGGSQVVSGTSASTALVSGVAGLIRTARPGLGAADTKAALINGSRRVTDLTGKVSAGGVVSASGALAAMQGADTEPSPTPSPRTEATPTPSPTPGDGDVGSGDTGGGAGAEVGATEPAGTLGAPGANLPNLDRAREIENVDPLAPEPIHSDQPCLTCGDGGGEPPATPAPGPNSNDPELSAQRTAPANQTGQPGVNLGSRNFNFSIPLVGLPGRSGMDLNLVLYYNSLVWVKEGNTIRFNTDRGFPGPGFRLGFPTIQQRYYNSQVGVWSYLLVTSSGGAVEMRQVGTTNIYETADGSYTQMTDNGAGGAVVRATDGTEMTFAPSAQGQMRCVKIMDRNGNYISAAYDGRGRLSNVTDTLGRVITFVYNVYGLAAIRQQRTNVTNGNAYTYTWATFTYDALTLQPNFAGLTAQGPQSSTFNVPSEIGLADGSSYKFEYTTFGQVWKIARYAADGGLLNHVSYNLSGSPINASSPQTGCPRFSSRSVWARDWNGDTDGVPAAHEEAGTGYEVDPNGAWTKVYTPDGSCLAQQFATSGWQKGLPTGTEMWIPGQSPVKVRWTTIAWTQDDETLSYQKNPRMVESKIYDDSGNVRRTTMAYHPATMFNLVKDVKEYLAGGASVLRTTHYEYNLETKFTDRRLIGLVSEQRIYKGDISAGVLAAKMAYGYDEMSGLIVYQGKPVNQENAYTSVNTTTVPRGNMTSVLRFNVKDQTDVVESNIAYNTAGSIIFTRDALNRRTATIGYGDAYYNDATARNTLSYPTSVTDAESYTSGAEYDYDTGLLRKTHTPSGGTGASITYADQLLDYDSAGRIIKSTNLNNSSYAKWVYPTTQLLVQQYQMVQNGQGLAYSGQTLDGAGRVRGTFSELPDATGFYTGQRINYDAMGRAFEKSNPTTMDGATWAPRGDDLDTGWYWTRQQYDWKGRPTVTTKQDGSATSASYDGCGCAGGEAATYTDERGRQRRLTKDILGRLSKVEELNRDAAHTVYATTTYTYDVMDRMTQINQGGQLRKFIYDGHGRLESRATPEQGTTDYTYNTDDTVNVVTDARGVTTTFGYTARHLVKSVNYTITAGVTETPDLTFTYDAAGHRESMVEALPGKTVGTTTYDYNDLGQLTSETRSFSDATPAPAPVTLSYEYNWGGELTKMTSSLGQEVGYVYDRIGRVTKVTGAGYAGVTGYVDTVDYRAFGVKNVGYSNGKTLAVTYDSRMRTKRWNVAGVLGWDYNYNYFGEKTGRVTYADSLNDPKLDRSYDYDQAGRLSISYTGTSARGHVGLTTTWEADGAYAGDAYNYDQWGNMTEHRGWFKDQQEAFISATYTETFNARNQLTKNPVTGATMIYDPAGNLKNDGTWALTYDATGQQTEGRSAGVLSLVQSYDGDRLRVKKVENGVTTYYVRSTMLGGQVVAELDPNGQHRRGYVYMGGQLLAIQENNAVTWAHQDPVTKSQRFTNSAGVSQSQRVDLDPWGVETNRSVNSQMQPHRFTTYERDANGSDEAMQRRYNSVRNRFDQPDPYDGSYDLTNPQSLNRYSYVHNDPVNFVDPTGLMEDLVPHCPDGAICAYVTVSIDLSSPAAFEDFLDWIHELDNAGDVIDVGGEGRGGRGGGGGGTQKPNPCSGSIPEDAARAILDAAEKEGVDPTLLSVTWRHEAIPSFGSNPQPNPRFEGKGRGRKLVGWDVGPLQLSTNYFGKSPFTDGLPGAFGTISMNASTHEYEGFNGNLSDNLRAGARAFTKDILGRSKSLADAAGLYRAGQRTGPGYTARFNEYNNEARGDRAQLNCLKGQK